MKASRKQLALLRSLDTRKGRDESGLFLVEGARLCAELVLVRTPMELHDATEGGCAIHGACGAGALAGEIGTRGLPRAGVQVKFAVVAEGAESSAPVAQAAQALRDAGVPLYDVAPHDFARVSDTVNSQGIVAAARWREQTSEELRLPERAIVVALDAVGDPGNVGTVIRTAAWFGVSAVLLGEGCADLLNPKTVRATMGGLFQLPVCRDVDLAGALARLKEQGFSVAAATMGGSNDWAAWAAPAPAALLLGSEAHGVSPVLLKLADMQVTIPRRGKGESLNVAVSAGILLSALGAR